MLLVGLIGWVSVASAQGGPNRAEPPHITAAEVYYDVEDTDNDGVADSDEIAIRGENLKDDMQHPAVSLGGTELTVLASTPASVRARLPDGWEALFQPGDHLLVLESRVADTTPTEFMLTLGTTGPQGPKGDPGADGQNGADGTSCSVGKAGDTATISCTDGTTADVIDGAVGPAGADGADGADGAPGGPGPAGADGLDCWDLNGNRAQDPTEDINGDQVFDALDCKGEQGAQGLPGPEGQQGPEGPQGPQGEPGLKNEVCKLYSLLDFARPPSLVSPESLQVTTTCTDGIDNDCDGTVDALDTDCHLTEICDDGIDNDGDGLIDAFDPDCATPEMCADLIDNDFDGLFDCDDPDCDIAVECGFCPTVGPENNNTSFAATDLGSFNDSPSQSTERTANITPAGDVDWYTFRAVDLSQNTLFDPFIADVRFLQNPGARYFLRLYKATGAGQIEILCSSSFGCAEGGISGPDDTARYFVEVLSVGGVEVCEEYILEVSNGKY